MANLSGRKVIRLVLVANAIPMALLVVPVALAGWWGLLDPKTVKLFLVGGPLGILAWFAYRCWAVWAAEKSRR